MNERDTVRKAVRIRNFSIRPLGFSEFARSGQQPLQNGQLLFSYCIEEARVRIFAQHLEPAKQ